MKKPTIETEQEKKSRETVEAIADNISKLAKSVAALLNGPLNKRALIILLANSSRESQASVQAVLGALYTMERDWLNKR